METKNITIVTLKTVAVCDISLFSGKVYGRICA